MVVVLSDNGRSYAPTAGALALHLRGLRRAPKGTGGGPRTSGPAEQHAVTSAAGPAMGGHPSSGETGSTQRGSTTPVPMPRAPLDTTPSPPWSA
ncbi:hypothetical protein ABZ250_08570 [Streptomyces afghaniensis]|uniref:hypothetical protein n=1 Tax=Streptomyces afghaniensis TaxID=66865 RepID=UPI0033BF747E